MVPNILKGRLTGGYGRTGCPQAGMTIRDKTRLGTRVIGMSFPLAGIHIPLTPGERGGLDLKAHEHNDWSPGLSIRLSMEFDKLFCGERHVRLMAVMYEGYAPFGQFYDQEVDYHGLQLGFGF